MKAFKTRYFLILGSFLLGLLASSRATKADDVVGPLVGAVDGTSARLLYRPEAAEQPLRLSVLLDGIVGGHREGTGRNFDGWIDEVSVWQGEMADLPAY